MRINGTLLNPEYSLERGIWHLVVLKPGKNQAKGGNLDIGKISLFFFFAHYQFQLRRLAIDIKIHPPGTFHTWVMIHTYL